MADVEVIQLVNVGDSSFITLYISSLNLWHVLRRLCYLDHLEILEVWCECSPNIALEFWLVRHLNQSFQCSTYGALSLPRFYRTNLRPQIRSLSSFSTIPSECPS